MPIMCGTVLSTATAVMLGSLAEAEVWVALVLVVIPTALVCATVIILVLAVERRDRVLAIKALPAVVIALGRQAGSRVLRHARGGSGHARGPGLESAGRTRPRR